MINPILNFWTTTTPPPPPPPLWFVNTVCVNVCNMFVVDTFKLYNLNFIKNNHDIGMFILVRWRTCISMFILRSTACSILFTLVACFRDLQCRCLKHMTDKSLASQIIWIGCVKWNTCNLKVKIEIKIIQYNEASTLFVITLPMRDVVFIQRNLHVLLLLEPYIKFLKNTDKKSSFMPQRGTCMCLMIS